MVKVEGAEKSPGFTGLAAVCLLVVLEVLEVLEVVGELERSWDRT